MREIEGEKEEIVTERGREIENEEILNEIYRKKITYIHIFDKCNTTVLV